ncbi:MAG: hypothetical protein K2G35_04350, partial [Duncaniella sp.]|nr:hypothetical protein [Duncaniella sp.]
CSRATRLSDKHKASKKNEFYYSRIFPQTYIVLFLELTYIIKAGVVTFKGRRLSHRGGRRQLVFLNFHTSNLLQDAKI